MVTARTITEEKQQRPLMVYPVFPAKMRRVSRYYISARMDGK
jgi:hypothetical protein